MTRAVTFDSFGTIVSMESPGPLLASALGVDVTRAEMAFRLEISYYLAHHLEGRDPESLSELRDRCALVLRDALGAPEPPLSEVRAAMLDSIRFSAFPDAVPVLRELRGRGLRLVVCSNWDCSLPEVLDSCGLLELVDGVVASAAVGADKPAPLVFERALSLCGCAADEALHVGDSPRADVDGARAAGMRAVLIDRSGGEGDIASLAELPALI